MIDPTSVKIGDEYWIAGYTTDSQATIPCPVCNGQKRITVILGNGEELHPECDYCSTGQDYALGYVIEHTKKAAPEKRRVTSITSDEDPGAIKIRSRTSGCSWRVLEPEKMFRTEGEAQTASEALLADWQESVDRRNQEMRHSRAKHKGWDVGYFMRHAKALREEAARFEARAGMQVSP